MPVKIAIFASGSGSNAENIITYFNTKSQASVELVLSNNADAFVLERAKKMGVASKCFTREELNNSELVLKSLKEFEIDFVVLAGFLLRIPSNIIQAYPNRIVNIHPALLPKYGGKGMFGNSVHEAVVAAGETESGITIHYINEHYDEGSIIFQAKCKVLETDDAEKLAEKVHALEYEYFPQIIEQLINAL